MPSIPFTNDSTRAQESNSLRSKVSEQSEELSVRTDDNKQALFTLTAKKSWKPWTHKAYFLVPTILASGALIAILQIYLERSNRDTGILFASRIIDLPLDQKFPYLYLPTIVSLLLSFAWAWLDLDVRRLQPFLELSKERGARGTDSLLLHYPFDFVALVLFAAAKRRHWPVFSASLAVVIIHWGLTPLQSIDLQCERDNGSLSSSNGCHYSAQNMALPPKIKDDEYYSLYVGYWYEESMDSYLLGSCPDDANQTLLVRWSRGQQRQANLALNEIATVPKEEATLWCTSSYYQQDVEATVSVPAMGVLEIVPTGPKTALPMDFFNVTDFEWGLSQGSDKNANRGTYPDVGIGGGWPSPYDRLCHEFPKLVWDPQSAYLSNMATFALGTYQRPMAEYLDAEVLKDSYQAAYRLLFARRLSNVLHPALNISTTVLGSRRYSTQTIIMVPAFVYVVETMIAFTATAAFVTNNGLPLPSKSLFVNQLLKNYLPMVVGASFEPIFTMITSTLCMLQPYEQLRRGHEKPGRSITLNYASLPPQAVVFRALKNKHIGLAFVSLMTILANVLSVAFSGLLTESSVLISQNTDFMATHQFPLNGTSIGNESLSRNRPSYDSYYVASSNLTADTPLPPWTDGQYFYLPFEPYVPSAANITQRKAATPAVKASLHCFPMRQVTNGRDLTLKTPDGRITCDLGLWASFTSAHNNTPQAIEHVSFASSDQSEQGPEYCDLKVMAGWTRASKAPDSGPLNASWVGCMPALQVDVREVTVDLKGNVLFSTPLNSTTGIPEHVFEPDDMGVVNSVHKVLDATSLVGLSHITNPSWHNDSYPSNFINYLMAQTTNSTAFLDPVLSPPPFEEVAPLLDLLYSKLFAITLANNIDKILCPSSDTTTLTGVSMGPETRIFAQEEMLFVAVVILAVFFLVTLVLYIRRPWRILPRMPTTLASQIAFFAASHALVDLAETSGMSEKERNSYVKGLEQTYGFGRFVGTDGKPHIGIEREPLVQILTKQDLRAMRKDAVID
ncbi:hypothetical protein KCU62_g6191, partial [Aureobasidium sp. EXF-3399]